MEYSKKYRKLIRDLDRSIAQFDQDGRTHHGRMTARARRITGLGWTYSAVILLGAMQENTMTRMTDLSERIGIASPTVTKLIKDLESKGFVKRVPHEEDGRASLVGLADEGRRVAAMIDRARLKALEETLVDWSEEDLQHFIALFTRLQTDLQRLS